MLAVVVRASHWGPLTVAIGLHPPPRKHGGMGLAEASRWVVSVSR